MKIRFSQLLFPTILLVLSACGGVSDTVVLSELTAEEEQELCEESRDSFDTPTSDQLCEAGAALNTTDATTCESVKTTCLEDPPSIPPTDCTARSTTLSTCTSTVGDLRACSNALGRNLAVYATLTCGDAPATAVELDPSQIPECDVYLAGCGN